MQVLVPVPRSRPRAVLAAAAALLAATFAGTTAAGAATSVTTPTAPVRLPAAIEAFPPYQPQAYCDPVTKPGVTDVARLLTATYPGTSIVSLARPCGTDTSEHYDGRALDWGVDHRDDRQRAEGTAFLHWLFATDAAGHRDAMVRRLGVMYVIWDGRIWGSWDQQWEPYACSGVTACHVDHMHLSFDWSGALAKTSFWTGQVSGPTAPPLLTLRDVGATQTITVPLHAADPIRLLRAVAGRYRFTVSGTYRADASTTHLADAECSTRDGTHWVAVPPGDAAASTGTDDLWVNSHRYWRPVSGAASGCDATHHYVRTLTFAGPTALAFSIADPDRWSGSGVLSVTVRRVG
jgi:hypothetical protein